MSEAISISDVSFRYPDGTVALDGVSLRIGQGERVGIVGANGAGKSTFLNHLNGCILPQTGVVSIEGVAVGKKTAQQVKRTVGLVFQNPDDQLFSSTVQEDVAFGPVNLGLDKGTVGSRVEKTLKDLGIFELREKAPYHLSQGQKRFAAIAAVLVMEPTILVMDEPTSDLDPRNRRNLINLLRRLAGTKVIASHDLDFIWDTCERVVVFQNGRVAHDGPTRTILASREMMEECGLELPFRLQ